LTNKTASKETVHFFYVVNTNRAGYEEKELKDVCGMGIRMKVFKKPSGWSNLLRKEARLQSADTQYEDKMINMKTTVAVVPLMHLVFFVVAPQGRTTHLTPSPPPPPPPPFLTTILISFQERERNLVCLVGFSCFFCGSSLRKISIKKEKILYNYVT